MRAVKLIGEQHQVEALQRNVSGDCELAGGKENGRRQRPFCDGLLQTIPQNRIEFDSILCEFPIVIHTNLLKVCRPAVLTLRFVNAIVETRYRKAAPIGVARHCPRGQSTDASSSSSGPVARSALATNEIVDDVSINDRPSSMAAVTQTVAP